ncbi:cell division protein ZapA [Thiocapsa imhoffii]|uniref:Cell division protein ZapA n=1 Tax=Thiocapsa imhoffii TaxID=382777 RepID=A0A9X0WG01_9GAMM|nr:cell division protein ZapA [Thiocapsa imhoffii]
MSEEPIQVSIRILDKDYRIACEPREQEGLRESARLLDGKMREIRKTGRVIGSDRIAVMAALNIAHELYQFQRLRGGDPTENEQRLARLQDRIVDALATNQALDAQNERV